MASTGSHAFDRTNPWFFKLYSGTTVGQAKKFTEATVHCPTGIALAGQRSVSEAPVPIGNRRRGDVPYRTIYLPPALFFR